MKLILLSFVCLGFSLHIVKASFAEKKPLVSVVKSTGFAGKAVRKFGVCKPSPLPKKKSISGLIGTSSVFPETIMAQAVVLLQAV